MTTDIQIRKDFIESYMENKDISLNNLAKQIGISPATLSRVLSGKRKPGQLVIGKMLSYFEVDFEALFFFNNKLTKVNKVKSA